MAGTGNLELVQSLYEAFGRGDIPAVLSSLDAHVEWIEAEGGRCGRTYRSPDAVFQGVFMNLGTEWEGFQVVPHEFVDGGDTVVVIGEKRGTFKAAGKSMKVPAAYVLKLRDGKVISFSQYIDTAIVQRAIES